MAALGITLGISIGGGLISGLIAGKLMEKCSKLEELFDDKVHFLHAEYDAVVDVENVQAVPQATDRDGVELAKVHNNNNAVE